MYLKVCVWDCAYVGHSCATFKYNLTDMSEPTVGQTDKASADSLLQRFPALNLSPRNPIGQRCTQLPVSRFRSGLCPTYRKALDRHFMQPFTGSQTSHPRAHSPGKPKYRLININIIEIYKVILIVFLLFYVDFDWFRHVHQTNVCGSRVIYFQTSNSVSMWQPQPSRSGD